MARRRRPGGLTTLADFLELPQDAVFDLPRLTVVGNGKLVLENHRGLITYQNDLIRVSVTLGEIEITGQDLKLKVIRPDAITVEGIIKAISFR